MTKLPLLFCGSGSLYGGRVCDVFGEYIKIPSVFIKQPNKHNKIHSSALDVETRCLLNCLSHFTHLILVSILYELSHFHNYPYLYRGTSINK